MSARTTQEHIAIQIECAKIERQLRGQLQVLLRAQVSGATVTAREAAQHIRAAHERWEALFE